MPARGSADERTVDHRLMLKLLLLALSMGAVTVLAACGQVVTRQPTARPYSPPDTPTSAPTARAQRPTTSVPSSPLPDPVTPTITPTPIVHVVQQGDTLQAIAFDFGVSVEALQRVNGVQNPQFLQVGQRLIIPFDEDPGQTTPRLLLPTPTPQPIQVQGVAFYETPVGSLLGLGEVANTTAVTLTNVQLQVALLDAAGEPVMETNTFASLEIVPPGGRSPFGVLFMTPPQDWVSYRVTIIRGQEAGALAGAYVPISVSHTEGGPSGPQYRVHGAVKNVSSGRTAESLEIVVTTYDTQGTVTGFRRSALALAGSGKGLSPGEETTFSISLATHGDVPDGFTVSVLGRAVQATSSGG